ncbi:MAG: CRISPR-associated endonuclease Cas1 [Magnetococcales bacterium]|nr:CRISPR-associated endonuclease Cas1 [Magnetococcales bacterium]
MPTLYVTQQGAVVRLSGASLHVTQEIDPDGDGPLPPGRTVLLEVEPHRLEMVALVGRVHITQDALKLCLDKGIGVAWFSWNGKFLGRMVPEAARSGDLRLAQYRAAVDATLCLDLARRVVSGKLTNAVVTLKGIQSNQPGLEDLSQALRDLGEYRQRVAECGDVGALLGFEGGAAACYFGVLDRGFRGEIRFPGRKRRPPPDAANALLSFGYVLLGNLIGGHLEARGLDPAVGFFHAPRPGRASLALDLLEEFRHAIVDRFVMRVCNLRMLQPGMFENDAQEGGVRLNREGLRLFFRAWGEHLEKPLPESGGGKVSPQELIRRQVNRMAMTLRGEDQYEPFLMQD